jgi:hypothetical protein
MPAAIHQYAGCCAASTKSAEGHTCAAYYAHAWLTKSIHAICFTGLMPVVVLEPACH